MHPISLISEFDDPTDHGLNNLKIPESNFSHEATLVNLMSCTSEGGNMSYFFGCGDCFDGKHLSLSLQFHLNASCFFPTDSHFNPKCAIC